eukprot:1190319-Prorocentrum_minimum.AAC.5
MSTAGVDTYWCVSIVGNRAADNFPTECTQRVEGVHLGWKTDSLGPPYSNLSPLSSRYAHAVGKISTTAPRVQSSCSVKSVGTALLRVSSPLLRGVARASFCFCFVSFVGFDWTVQAWGQQRGGASPPRPIATGVSAGGAPDDSQRAGGAGGARAARS